MTMIVNYITARGKTYNFINFCYLLFLRNTYERDLSWKDADNEQSKLANELKSIEKGIKPAAKTSFLSNIGLFLSTREKVINNFISEYFQ